jgi:hypothetical protein
LGGHTRYNIARLLQTDHRPGDALHYARAALRNYERTGRDAVDAREPITQIDRKAVSGKRPARLQSQQSCAWTILRRDVLCSV